jgi:hypothetical protein
MSDGRQGQCRYVLKAGIQTRKKCYKAEEWHCERRGDAGKEDR